MELEIEQSFFSDLCWVLVSRLHQHTQNWPGSKTLAIKLNRLKAKYNVSFDDLKATKLFKNGDESIHSFVLFYREFNFLKPIKITKFGKEPRTSRERQLFEIKKINHEYCEELYSNCSSEGNMSAGAGAAGQHVTNSACNFEGGETADITCSVLVENQNAAAAGQHVTNSACDFEGGEKADTTCSVLVENQDENEVDQESEIDCNCFFEILNFNPRNSIQ